MYLIFLREGAAIEVCAVEAMVHRRVPGVLSTDATGAQQERPRRRSLKTRSLVDVVFTFGIKCDQLFGFQEEAMRQFRSRDVVKCATGPNWSKKDTRRSGVVDAVLKRMTRNNYARHKDTQEGEG